MLKAPSFGWIWNPLCLMITCGPWILLSFRALTSSSSRLSLAIWDILPYILIIPGLTICLWCLCWITVTFCLELWNKVSSPGSRRAPCYFIMSSLMLLLNCCSSSVVIAFIVKCCYKQLSNMFHPSDPPLSLSSTKLFSLCKGLITPITLLVVSLGFMPHSQMLKGIKYCMNLTSLLYHRKLWKLSINSSLSDIILQWNFKQFSPFYSLPIHPYVGGNVLHYLLTLGLSPDSSPLVWGALPKSPDSKLYCLIWSLGCIIPLYNWSNRPIYP